MSVVILHWYVVTAQHTHEAAEMRQHAVTSETNLIQKVLGTFRAPIYGELKSQ